MLWATKDRRAHHSPYKIMCQPPSEHLDDLLLDLLLISHILGCTQYVFWAEVLQPLTTLMGAVPWFVFSPVFIE